MKGGVQLIWKSVKTDKMPPVGQDVLVRTGGQFGHGAFDVQCVFRGEKQENGEYSRVFAQGWNEGEAFEVTHWAEIEFPEKDFAE